MNCQAIKTADVAENYLRNRLSEAEMDEFETHLLECAPCSRELELLQTMHADLTARAHDIRTWTATPPFFLRWQTIAATAVAVVVIVGALFFRHEKAEQALIPQHAPAPSHPTEQDQALMAQTVPNASELNSTKIDSSQSAKGGNSVGLSPHSGKPIKVSAPSIGIAPDSGLDLSATNKKSKGSEIAAIAPANSGNAGQVSTQVTQTKPTGSKPRQAKSAQERESPALTAAQGVELYYLGSAVAPPFTFAGFANKGLTTKEGGAAMAQPHGPQAVDTGRSVFREAMTSYLEGKYSEASDLLDQAAAKEPSAPDVQFYLGVCRLLAGQPQRAIDPLRNASNVSSPVRQQEAHYFLAKAFVQSVRLQEAEEEFRIAADMTGPLKSDAGAQLKRLQALRAQLGQN